MFHKVLSPLLLSCAILGLTFFLSACANQHEGMHDMKNHDMMNHEMKPDNMKMVTKAVAVMRPTGTNQAAGVITFTKEAAGVRVQGSISGLTPGEHGFHVHQWGDCSAADGTSAGGHFNPENMNHAAQTEAVRHVGDLGNVTANAQGIATINFLDTKIAFFGMASIIGRGLILHDKVDDLKTQPTGNAGARLACGVIGVGAEQ